MSAHLECLVFVARLCIWSLRLTVIGQSVSRNCYWRSLPTLSGRPQVQAPQCSRHFALDEVLCWMRCGRRRWVLKAATWLPHCAGFACRAKV